MKEEDKITNKVPNEQNESKVRKTEQKFLTDEHFRNKLETNCSWLTLLIFYLLLFFSSEQTFSTWFKTTMFAWSNFACLCVSTVSCFPIGHFTSAQRQELRQMNGLRSSTGSWWVPSDWFTWIILSVVRSVGKEI